jgi:hypothetical protein
MDGTIIDLLKGMRQMILHTAVEHGMSFSDASHELDALIAGNDGAYTQRIRRIIEVWREQALDTPR